jgi:hypothetical protein
MIHTVTIGPVIMETDSMELVNLWNKREVQRSEFTPLFHEVQEVASSSFCVVYTKRSANRVAHACAKFAFSSAFDVWANDPPSFLLQALQDDCNLISG